MTNHISSLAKRLLISNAFFRAGNLITKIFVNVYILKTTGDLKIAAVFSLMILIGHFSSYSIFSFVIKYGFRNISHIASILGTVGIFLCFIFFPEKIGEYAFIIGTFLGICSGIYWCVYNVHQFDLTLPKNRGNFEGLKKSLRTGIAVVVPALAGSIITINYLGLGYEMVFALGILFYSTAGVLGVIGFHAPSNTGLHIRELIVLVSKHRDIWKIFLLLFCVNFAISLPLIEVVFPLIFFSRGIGELGIGLIVSVVSVVSVVSSYVFGKFVHYKYYKLSFISATCIYLVLLLLLIVFPNEIMFGIFVSLVSFLYIFVDIPLSVFASNATHEIPNYKKYKEEYILLREFFVISGRVLTFVIIFFLGSFSNLSLQIIFSSMAFLVIVSILLFSSTSMKYE